MPWKEGEGVVAEMKQDHLYLLTVCLILLLLAATGCGRRLQTFPDQPDNSFVQLRGNWVSQCVSDSISGKFQIQRYEFGAADFTLSKTAYLDAACSQPERTVRAVGRYQALKLLETRDAYPVDYMVTQVQVTYHTPSSATRAQTESFSGTDQWTVDVPNDVTGEDADPLYGNGTKYFKRFEISYGICAVESDRIECAEWGTDVGVPSQGINPQSRNLMPLATEFGTDS